MNIENIRAIREFNRSYTKILKLTDKYHLNTHFTLLESRILLEIDRGVNSANQLMLLLHLDKGYLSRVLKKLTKDDLIQDARDSIDKRIKTLQLTDQGKKALEIINQRANQQVENLFANIPEEKLQSLIKDMQDITDTVKKYSQAKE
ncbi:hypothetical protein LCR01_15980 [Companilactobacillus crustorum]|nr:winged helix DNA-binding protein [Companilactobacillus crustorum]WDT65318.1 winged helix DNA-binding protein [Companilactobacillus crustorum]GEO77155.1 hypothetical protein LCR01_15980 [Companilactobacillus crustorum]